MLLTVKLNPTHKKDRFTCEEQSLENYLRKQAGQDVRKQVAACCILEGEGATVRG